MRHLRIRILFVAFAGLPLAGAQAASTQAKPSVARPPDPSLRSTAVWQLRSFLQLARDNPRRLVRLGRAYFSEARLRRASVDAELAFEWQDRLAVVGAVTDFFDPEAERALGAHKARYRDAARDLLVRALLSDPSLLVRDGAVESIRRIQRMQPGLNSQWLKPLERAFLDNRNAIQGEGLFIRETILTALREGSLPLAPSIKRSAAKDRNPQVRELLRAWDTSAYQRL